MNVQSLIDNNIIYKKTLKDIESNQQKYLKNFDTKENELKTKLKDIEEGKLILSDEEINFQIENYNNELSKFTALIEEFNLHYQNQIINIKEVYFNVSLSEANGGKFSCHVKGVLVGQTLDVDLDIDVRNPLTIAKALGERIVHGISDYIG